MTNLRNSPYDYEKISLDELVTYAVYCLFLETREATFENIVAKCFELFPKRFHLVGYPQWPDSARVNKAWLRCRTDFKYISGTVKGGFRLTAKGLEIAEGVLKRISSSAYKRSELKRHVLEERAREEGFINEIEKHSLFEKYLKTGENMEITEYEFCDLIFCTMETPYETRRKKLSLLKDYAEKLGRSKVLKFLEQCEGQCMNYLAKTTDMNDHQPKGGMMKRKNRGRRKKKE